MNIDQLTINTIRMLSAEAVEKAKSGHPGLPLGAAPMSYTLWSKVMNHNPKNPNWVNRDRFILSAGHGSMLLYSLLHIFNYGLEIQDLKDFRQLDSKTPGHPEYGHTVGVEATTGPLGQGISMGVGMAMAEAHLAATFNKDNFNIMDHYTYILCGDGDMMEGISNEAISLAGSLELNKLIVLYDSNSITIEGSTDLAFKEDVRKRFEALGWATSLVEDGNDVADIEKAIKEAKGNDKPTMIEIRTEIGYGSPGKQGKASAHGEPLGAENILGMREFLEWKEEDEFFVPDAVRDHMDSLTKAGQETEEKWNEMFKEYKEKYPELAKKLESYFKRELPLDYLKSDEFWDFDKDMATREASGIVLNRIADRVPNIFGGSADLAPSNKTNMKNRESFSAENYAGSNVHFGVREHGMAAAINGIALHGGLRPYGGTFFVFTDYMKPSMRLSSLMNVPVTYILTHDSIGVGEDGPTHQPIEQMAMLRAQPNFIAFRPADARETAAAWYTSLTRDETPLGLVLTRQKLPLLEGTGKDALKGAYILKKEKKELDIILMASGSEVHLAYEAAKIVESEKNVGIRVVSMPSWELFEEQDEAYREEVLPSNIDKRISVEALSSLGWHKYVGMKGKVMSLDIYGASAPGNKLFERFNFTVGNVVNTILEIL